MCESQCPTACGVHIQILTLFPLTMCEFHSAQQHVMCTYRYWQCSHTQCVFDSAPQPVVSTYRYWPSSHTVYNMWVSQCPTACGVCIRYWQCSHTQCVSFTELYSMWYVPADTVFPHTVYEFRSAPQPVLCTYRHSQSSHTQCVSFIVPHSMWCAPTDNGSVPTHSIWVSQCPTARDVYLEILTVFPPTMCEFYNALHHVLYRYWQCFHTQCVSLTVPHSTWCAHCNLGRDILTSSPSFIVICWIVICNSSLIHYILLSSVMLGDVP